MSEPTPAELRQLIAANTPAVPAGGSIAIVEQAFPESTLDGYTLYLPRTYDEEPARVFPVLVFLQGGNAVGGDVAAAHEWGLARMLWEESQADSEHHRLVLDTFVIITPHIASGQFFEQEAAIEQILYDVVAGHRADPARVYVTGLSRGGHGTWGLAARLPERFAAAAPIGGNTSGVDDWRALADMPLWIAHNTGDGVVPFGEILDAVTMIEVRGGEPFAAFDRFDLTEADWQGKQRILVRPELDHHDAWTETYGGTALFRWFLSHARSDVECQSPVAQAAGEWY